MLFPLFSFWSFGEEPSHPLQKVRDATVKIEVNIHDDSGNHREISSGFLMKDREGKVKVITNFHNVNNIPYGSNADISIQYKGRSFPVKENIALFSLDDLAILEVEWDSETQKNVSVIQLRNEPLKNGEFFFLFGFPNDQFKAVPIRIRNSYTLNQLSFSTGELKLSGSSGGPLVDSRGRVFSVITNSSANYGFGVNEGVLRLILSRPFEVCSGSFRSCILNERKELYRKAKQGDQRAQWQLLKYHFWNNIEEFERFARSIGINDVDTIENDFYSFLRNVARFCLTAQYYLYRLTGDPVERQKVKEKSLEQAQKGSFIAQYFAGVLFREEGNLEAALQMFQKSGDQGFWPADKAIQKMNASFIEPDEAVKLGIPAHQMCRTSFKPIQPV